MYLFKESEENDMNKKSLMLIPVFGLFAIPQLLYFWLAPETESSIAVYCFGTVLSIVHLLLAYYLAITKEIRVVMGTIVIGTVVWIAGLITGGILLGADATNRTAVFAMMIVCVSYIICVISLLCTMGGDTTEHDNRHSSIMPNNSNRIFPKTFSPTSDTYSSYNSVPEIPIRRNNQNTVVNFGNTNNPSYNLSNNPSIPRGTTNNGSPRNAIGDATISINNSVRPLPGRQ